MCAIKQPSNHFIQYINLSCTHNLCEKNIMSRGPVLYGINIRKIFNSAHVQNFTPSFNGAARKKNGRPKN